MIGPSHSVTLKVWFSAEADAERLILSVQRDSVAHGDPSLEGGRRGKIVTLTGSDAEIMAHIQYKHLPRLMAGGFVTKTQMTTEGARA